MVVLLIMAKIWNQTRRPSVGEWLNELDVPMPWNTAISKKEHSADICYRMEHISKNIMLNERSQMEKHTHTHILYGFVYVKCPEKANLWRQKTD